MLKNYVLVALRNLRKNAFYTLTSIFGLAVGIACCLVILLYVVDELSYDKHHEKADRIYRGIVDMKFGEMEGKMSYMPAPFGPTVQSIYPEVELAGRLRGSGDWFVRRPDQTENISEEAFIWADPEIFQIFDFEVLAGDPVESFRQPETLVITRIAAEKFFPSAEAALNQTLVLDDKYTYKIVAVVARLPRQSHFNYDYYLSMTGREEAKNGIWLSHNFHNYLLLQPGADAAALEAKFKDLIATYAGPQLQQFLGTTPEKWFGEGNRIGYSLQPIADIHLHSSDIQGLSSGGDENTVVLFAGIALLVLLIACINFMNLATARSTRRAREVGVRKVLGSGRRQLIVQFLTESILLTAFAVVLAVGLAALLLPFFNEIAEKELSLPWSYSGFIPLLVLGTLVVGLLAGIYPAFFLSNFRPLRTLKGNFSSGRGSGMLRSLLVVLQFTASIALIACTLVVYQQMQYAFNKQIGYDRSQTMIVEMAWSLHNNIPIFNRRVEALPDVVTTSTSSFLPTWSERNNNAFSRGRSMRADNTLILQNWRVDTAYIPLLNIKLLDEQYPGSRNFSAKFPTDSLAVILNQTAVEQFGFEGDPIGQTITTLADLDTESGTKSLSHYHVIGVIQDFHTSNFTEPIEPLGLFLAQSRSYILVKIAPRQRDFRTVAAEVEAIWRDLAPGIPFSYSFLDDRFGRMFVSQEKLGKIFAAFAVLAIFVACLGLFALASYIAEQRRKEIAVRKVMGASEFDIVRLLARNFLLLVIMGFVVASVVSWFAMSRWLENFAYHAPLGVGPFLVAGVLALAIAALTVSWQSMRAARLDPARVLKDE